MTTARLAGLGDIEEIVRLPEILPAPRFHPGDTARNDETVAIRRRRTCGELGFTTAKESGMHQNPRHRAT